jgi:aryl-alcohol dehydrogenase-like predicted oxidoreductase
MGMSELYGCFRPRFQGENFQKNLDLVAKVREWAAAKRVTPSQLALAWVLAQGDNVAPIPGTKQRSYLEENARSLEIELSREELRAIDEVTPKGIAAGQRYPEARMQWVNV